MLELAANALERPADVQFGAVEVDRVPGQADNLTLPQAQHENQYVGAYLPGLGGYEEEWSCLIRTAAKGFRVDMLRLLALVAQVGTVAALMWVGTRVWLNRQRARNPGLRTEIATQVRFATNLDRASILHTKQLFEGPHWVSLQGPRRLTVGADAFIFSAPNVLTEYVFRGRGCSITISQAPSSMFVKRDWIVITGQDRGRDVELAISHDDLWEIWRALAGAGANQR